MNDSKHIRHTTTLESIPLDQETAEKFYRNTDAPPKGYIRLEAGGHKGVLQGSVRNLKYQDQPGYLYKLILLGQKEGRVIFVNTGTLIVNRNGHGEILYHFNPSDMNADHSGLFDFSSVVVAGISTKNIEEDMYPILMCSLPAFDNHDGKADPIDVPAFFRGESVTEKKKETPVKEPASEKKPLAEKESPPPRSRSSQSGKKATKQKANNTPQQPYQPQTYNHYYNDFIKTCCTQMDQTSGTFEQVSPFGNGIQGIRWYKILNIMYLPFINASCQFASSDYFRLRKPPDGPVHLSCQDLSARYRHFIFGIRQEASTDGQEAEIEKYYFGIPGMYCKEEQPDGGKSGFRYWQPLSGGTHEKNTYGYWIAAIDAKTGDVEEIPLPENE